ncbi:MAG: hypothetical protein U1E81_14375 [Xanthobacteraceae bacterium]
MYLAAFAARSCAPSREMAANPTKISELEKTRVAARSDGSRELGGGGAGRADADQHLVISAVRRYKRKA